MKVSQKQADENHERVLTTAAGLLRERGYDGIGVADLMKAAGLTHGGFYRKFASKEDLVVKATVRAAQSSHATLHAAPPDAPTATFQRMVETYVSPAHCEGTSSGCILPALAADCARRDDPALRAVFVEAIEASLRHIEAIRPTMPPSAEGRGAEAILAEMVGAVVLARALGAGDQADGLLDAVVADLMHPEAAGSRSPTSASSPRKGAATS